MVANLERVVRPFVVRDTRPTATQPVLPEEDEDSGIATISGVSGRMVNLSHTANDSFSRQRDSETQRTYDVMRVYNPNDHEQYVDVEAVTRLRTRNGLGIKKSLKLAKPQATANIEIIEEDQKRDAPA